MTPVDENDNMMIKMEMFTTIGIHPCQSNIIEMKDDQSEKEQSEKEQDNEEGINLISDEEIDGIFEQMKQKLILDQQTEEEENDGDHEIDENLDSESKSISTSSKKKMIRAIGELGLDFDRLNWSSKEAQVFYMVYFPLRIGRDDDEFDFLNHFLFSFN